MDKQKAYNIAFDYQDGFLIWKTPLSPRLKEGDLAGTIDGRGYLRTNIYGKLVANHIIIYIMHYGEYPDTLEIDHIDNDRLNNSIENLRLVTRTQNNLNRKGRTRTTGTYFSKERKKWVAQISHNNKNINIGRYETQEEAISAYQAMYKKLHNDFNK